jgi:polyhydroxybutyrate depolymerase
MKSTERTLAAILILILVQLACSSSRSTPPPFDNDSLHSIHVNGTKRTFIVHLPPAAIAGRQELPVVFAFHGGGGNAENQRKASNFDPLADSKGFIVVYPNGSGRLEDTLLTWNGGTCCGYAVTNNIDDVAFVRQMVVELQSLARIDLKRIYATGFSNGGIFSYRLACDASDLIAAIAPVSGTQNYPGCQPGEPVSVIDFHGSADENLPYDGGSGSKSISGVNFISVRDSIKFWVNFDRCQSLPETETNDNFQLEKYGNCTDGSDIELYIIFGGGHAWPGSSRPAGPGGDRPVQSIPATELIWQFFEAHPKP